MELAAESLIIADISKLAQVAGYGVSPDRVAAS
jgi:hypothetical protein